MIVSHNVLGMKLGDPGGPVMLRKLPLQDVKLLNEKAGAPATTPSGYRVLGRCSCSKMKGTHQNHQEILEQI
jgi:hypothetical protein